MSSVRLALTAAFVLAYQIGQSIGGEQFEASYRFEIEESSSLSGTPLRKRKLTCFTAVELPWMPLRLSGRDQHLRAGHVATEKVTTVRVGDRKLDGTEVIWMPRQGAVDRTRSASIRFWTVPDLPIPEFPLSLGRGTRIMAPEGCVRMAAVPHKKGSPGVTDHVLAYTCAASGQYEGKTTYSLGEKELPAHKFTYTTKTSESTRRTTLLLSKSVPGGVYSMTVEFVDIRRGKGIGVLKITSMNKVALPEGCEPFPKEGFFYAPPEGYKRMSKAGAGEVARFRKGSGAFISVSVLGHTKELATLYDSMLGQRGGVKPCITRAHHVAGHRSFTVSSEKSEVGHIYTQHAGRIYKVAVSGLHDMGSAEASALLRGWRWIKDKAQPEKSSAREIKKAQEKKNRAKQPVETPN